MRFGEREIRSIKNIVQLKQIDDNHVLKSIELTERNKNFIVSIK